MSIIRKKVYADNQDAGKVMDYLLFELVVAPLLDDINPEITHGKLLDILWDLVDKNYITIYYNQDEENFFADYDPVEVIELIDKAYIK